MNGTILIVEDTWEVRKLIQKIVSHILPDYQVKDVDNATSALDIVSRDIPSLIITDLDMPEVSGYDLISALYHSRETQNIPIIILTSHADRANDSRILYKLEDLGLPHLPIANKPLDIADFRAKVTGALSH